MNDHPFKKACVSAKGAFSAKQNLMECQVSGKVFESRPDSALSSACYFKSYLLTKSINDSIPPNGAKIIACDRSRTKNGIPLPSHQIEPYLQCVTSRGAVIDSNSGLSCIKYDPRYDRMLVSKL